MDARTSVTHFVVSFAKGDDIQTLHVIDVAYGCHWSEVEDNVELIVECAYAVAGEHGPDLSEHDAFMITHKHGDYRFALPR